MRNANTDNIQREKINFANQGFKLNHLLQADCDDSRILHR